MTKIENKLTYLLADPTIKEEELNKLYLKLENGGLKECFKKARQMRKILIESKRSHKKSELFDSNLSNYERKILNEVERLLRVEANMTVKNAMKALCEELPVNHVPSNRRSFKEQLLFLSSLIEGAQIISAAYKIRNDVIPNLNKSDWPLKEY